MGRITLDGKVSQYSTGEDVQPKFWDANKGRAVNIFHFLKAFPHRSGIPQGLP